MGQDGEAGFLSRWSRRKVQARQGEPLPEPVPPSLPPMAVPVPSTPEPAPQLQLAPEAPPPPTLDDVAELSAESDFRPFVAHDVQPEVKNAALKKLFTDPHYNVMDGLDTYIADYSQPDPLPPGMLEQMAQSAFLGLFTEDPAQDRPAADIDPDSGPATPTVVAAPLEHQPSPAPHEDTDLRLQPDDAAERSGAAAGPGGHAGCEP